MVMSFIDLNFAYGVLEIPQLELNDSSELLFRNVIAFDQTYMYLNIIFYDSENLHMKGLMTYKQFAFILGENVNQILILRNHLQVHFLHNLLHPPILIKYDQQLHLPQHNREENFFTVKKTNND
uniref:Uncharacterized protein n=1 Tax=Aegilops tauschii subsp. strangulata TaxID=200361 RepID=A0A453D9Q6_AEGTS